MTPKPTAQLPDAELDVMQILWQRNEPSPVAEICRDLQGIRPCTKPAVYILIDRLAAKDFVRVETGDSGKTVTALISEEDYGTFASDNFLTKICRGSWKRLIANLVSAGKLSDDDLDEIAEILRRKED